jgi:hypothetical protein
LRMHVSGNLDHLIALLLLIARLGDIGTTWLATPTLKLEANPIVRRLRWRYAALTVLACLIPYWSVPLGVAVLVASLLVSASNSSRIWFIRAMGEDRYAQLVADIAQNVRPWAAIGFILLAPMFFCLLGFTLLLFYPDPEADWGYYFALGVFAYAFVLALYGPLSFLRLRKAALRRGTRGA